MATELASALAREGAANVTPVHERERRTHDYGPGRRMLGHDYAITQVRDGGHQISASGWGCDGLDRIRVGDYLLLEATDRKRATRYEVASVIHLMDPDDMWHAELTFAPRQYASAEEKAASR